MSEIQQLAVNMLNQLMFIRKEINVLEVQLTELLLNINKYK